MSLLNAGRQNSYTIDTALLSRDKFNYRYEPLVKGNIAPEIKLHKKDAILNSSTGISTTEPVISARDLSKYGRPLVVLFYNALHKNIPDITKLISLNKDVRVMGGSMLVLTSTEPAYFNKIQLQENTLPVFYDEGNRAAEQFGLYNAENPLWNWVSGIEDEKLPLSAAYIISPARKIIFHHIDYSFELFSAKVFEDEFVRALLSGVFHSTEQNAGFSLEYKSVS